MREHHRILVVVEGHDHWTAKSLATYSARFDLGWDLIVVEQRFFQEAPPDRLESLSRCDAMVAWHLRELPDAWEVPPIRMFFGTTRLSVSLRFDLDDAGVGRLAARHFHSQGFPTVATIHHASLQVRNRRFTAFHAEARRQGLTTYRMEFHRASSDGETNLKSWLRTAPHPLGIFVHQDRDALHLLTLCRADGLSIPDQIGILGVDDIPACTAVQPTLSSIVPPRQLISAMMAERLHRLLTGDESQETVTIAPLQVATRDSTASPSCGDALVDRLRKRIAGHPGGRHDLPSLARAAGLSVSQLHRRFRAATKLTPGTWIDRCRLNLAQELLTDTDLTVDRIARRCGLGDPSSLWYLFHRSGMPSPTTWRTAVCPHPT
jgi:LacI family transcriptional regulator